MSFELGARNLPIDVDFTDLLEASSGAALNQAPQGRRARKRAIKQKLAHASMLAPLLAAEGCLTIGGRGGPQSSDETPAGPTGNPSGGGTPAPAVVQAVDDSHFHADVDHSIQIAATDLLANDLLPAGATAQVVRVFGAVNGVVTLHDGVIHFTPNPGFEGAASFQYEVRDSRGNVSRAEVDIHVGDAAQMPHHPGSGEDDSHGGHGGMPHPDDPSKAAEHMAVLDLVPVADATHVAVNNGSWFDPNTWANGEVPGAGARVVIPQGVEVMYDGESQVSLFTVRVDGALEFATDQNTFMEVDTFVVAPSGRLTIGTIDDPVDANVRAVIQIADNGPIDVAWDPMLLSRGVISHGHFETHGAEKDTFLKVAIDPMAGHTSLTLEAPPQGWQVGDKLVLTGTHLTESKEVAPMTPRNDQTEDEELTITRIEGNVVYFDKPLQYDHEAPRADLKAYVANYSRNVVFETENADSVPVHQRGHVMLMDSDNIDVRYSEFLELGRTDKSERATDVMELSHVESDSNVKARYSLHLHRAGVSDIDDPAYLVGNSVWGSPGWGFVQHDSNAVLTDNAAYDVYGAAFVAETGNEIGRWSHNIAIKSIGNSGGAKWHDDVDAFDLGRTGAGFWFQGRLVEAVDNVAAGMPGGHGFVYMSRGGGVIPVDPATAPWSESLRYFDEAVVNHPAISQFDDNEAFAVGTGVEVIKSNSEQHHDVRTVFDGFTAWEVINGVHLQYTAHYTLIDIDVIATDRSGGAGAPGSGIFIDVNSIDITLNGANVSGFPIGVKMAKEVINLNYPFDGDFGFVFIDVNVTGANTNFQNRTAQDIFLTREDLVEGRLDYESHLGLITHTDRPELHTYFDVSGTKTDSIGDVRVSPTWDPIRHDYFTVRNALVEEGYWTLPDGRKVTVIDQYFADRATGEIDKVAIIVDWERNFSDVNGVPHYNGVLDLNSQAPVARTDYATLSENGFIDINVLANDFDPDGDEISIDGLDPPSHGSLFLNDDGTVRYVADPNFVGTDTFGYWVEDENGNFDKGLVHVTVEI